MNTEGNEESSEERTKWVMGKLKVALSKEGLTPFAIEILVNRIQVGLPMRLSCSQ